MINRLFDKLLQEDERIEFVVHRHWISLIYPLVKSLLLGLIAPSLMLWLFANDIYLTLIGGFWLIAGLIWIVYIFLDWHYDVFLATDQHLIEVEWQGFFKNKTNRIRYENVDNISCNATGIFASIFNFADLIIVTYAGEEKDLRSASNAKEVQNLLMQRCDSKQESNKEDIVSKSALKDALKSLLQEELVEQENLVEAAPEDKTEEIVILEKRKIKKQK